MRAGGHLAGRQAIGEGGGDGAVAGRAVAGGDVALAPAPAAAGFRQGAAAQGFVQAQLHQGGEGIGEGVMATPYQDDARVFSRGLAGKSGRLVPRTLAPVSRLILISAPDNSRAP